MNEQLLERYEERNFADAELYFYCRSQAYCNLQIRLFLNLLPDYVLFTPDGVCHK